MQDTRATAFHERFFACGETALVALPALKTSLCAIRLFPTARMSCIKALQDEIERDKENTTLARFIRNLESRIYG